MTEAEALSSAARDEARYFALFQSLDDGLCICERVPGEPLDYRFLVANPAFERQSGLDNPVGKTIRQLVPALEESIIERYRTVEETRRPDTFVAHVDALGRWFEIQLAPGEQSNQVAVLFRDVTRRKSAEQEIASREQQFETLLNQAPIGVYLVDADFVIRQVNPVAMPVFGDIMDGPVGRNFDEVIHILWDREYADELVRIFRHTLETGEPYVTPERAEHRSDLDTVEYYEWRIDRIMLPDGRHGVVCYFRDISPQVHARKDVEQARELARDSERRLRLIVESARDYAIFTTDQNDIINEWLPGAEAVFGYSKEEAEGQPAAILFTPADRDDGVPQQEVVTALREGKAPGVRWHLRKGGERVFIEGQTVALFDATGALQGFLKIGQDVTEGQEAQVALRESEERFRQFGEASSDLLWIRDAETLALEYVSPAFENLYGVPREEVLESSDVQAWARLIHPDDRNAAIDALRTLRAGVPGTHEFRVIHPDGTERWIHNADFPLSDRNGNVQRIAGIAQDVTERRRAVEYQATLLAELQHRVRNILALIQSVVRRTLDTSISAEEYGRHLAGRINAMARTQALLTRSPSHQVELEDLLRDELLTVTAQEGRYWCEGPQVRLEPKAAEVLTLAVHELATNAVKFGALSQDRGQIEIGWAIEQRGGERWLNFEWEESRVDGVEPPLRTGFGTELITRRVPYELGGAGSLEPVTDGIRASITFPLRPGNSILQTGPAEELG